MTQIEIHIPAELDRNGSIRRAVYAMACMPEQMTRGEAREHLHVVARLWADAAADIQQAADDL